MSSSVSNENQIQVKKGQKIKENYYGSQMGRNTFAGLYVLGTKKTS